MSGQIDNSTLGYIINHVFLPPTLPCRVDVNVEPKIQSLLGLIKGSAKAYQDGLTASKSQWDSGIKMLSMMEEIQPRGCLSSQNLDKAIGNMRTGDVLALHIQAQNAGLILRQTEEDIIFEAFEASPRSEDVIACQGRLLCSFPGPAVAVSIEKAKNVEFRLELSCFLEKMNVDGLEDAMSTSRKGGSDHIETRETTNPRYITELLNEILLAVGKPAEVHRIQKRIADDVLWDDTELPWRRSPLWLTIRVALQSTVDRPTGISGYVQYKAFMVFFMTDILEIALNRNLPSDTLFVMNAKLGRRTFKMGKRGGLPAFLLKKVSDQLGKVTQVLGRRWKQVNQAHSTPFKWTPQALSSEDNMQLSLAQSGGYIAAAVSRIPTIARSKVYVPNEERRIDPKSKDIPPLPVRDKSAPELQILLIDFERWVRESLDSWVMKNLQNEEACRVLCSSIEVYTLHGKRAYVFNPESMSILILTTMELWVALDKIAVNTCSLLSEYFFTEFANRPFNHLLLPRYHQIERLHRIEIYLKERREKADRNATCIFSNKADPKTFAVRYYLNSPKHQSIHKKIELDATAEREKKIQEFEEKRRLYNDAVARVAERPCDYIHSDGGRRAYHDPECYKCRWKKYANTLNIQVHEWPLPRDPDCLAMVVFELECPIGFCAWRDATYLVMVDILSPPLILEVPDARPYTDLNTYCGLRQYFKCQSQQRLRFSSVTKATTQSHYAKICLTNNSNSVCVNNALRYGLWDSVGLNWVDGRVSANKCDIQNICTFKLPEGPYQKLQYAINSTMHTPNEVISRQHECPKALSFHEYIAFGFLRAGHRLQWLNIVRELRTRTLTFRNEAVNILLMQAAWYTGPPNTESPGATRESFTILEDTAFGHNLLQELGSMLTSIEANWLEGVSAKSIIWLTTRLLTVASSLNIRNSAFCLLRRVRAVTLEWTRQLATQIQKCEKEDELEDLKIRALQMAIICRATYDVDHGDFWHVLSTGADVATLVECAIIIHNNTPPKMDHLSPQTHFLLDRDRRLSAALKEHLERLIFSSNDGLNRCILRMWSAYKQGSLWSMSNSRWIKTNTAAISGNASQEVQYNLLSGQLLVDGLPLARMGTDYILHPTYTRLFLEKVFDVFPSNLPGMQFQARHQIFGHQVHFGMQGNELLIKAQIDGTEYELVPHTKLQGDFPVHFTKNYFHWLEIKTRILEFRPKSNPWKSSATNWRLTYLGLASCMALRNERMMDIRKASFSMITSVLGRLEPPKYIDITFALDTRTVLIHLPRLKMDFFINEKGEIECRQFRGMVIDFNQDIGTFTGLVNRLVMRQKSVRSVIIPYGDVRYKTQRGHVIVEIETDIDGLDRVPYLHYTVDTRLGRLVGNDSLTSHLFKTYLHALTTYCLPDELTRRTGTEEALANLKSATTWSFQKLGDVEIKLLKLIMSLTPSRDYYPKHKKVMQTIKWKPLPYLTQHEDFELLVTSIFRYACRFHMLRVDDKTLDLEDLLSNASDHLLRRAAIRNATIRRDEFGGANYTELNDSVYSSRDFIPQNSKLKNDVWDIARSIEKWSTNLAIHHDLEDLLKRWELICGSSTRVTVLQYNRSILDLSLDSCWVDLYNTLRATAMHESKYRLMFTLCTMAYSGKQDMLIIGTLLAFAINENFSRISPPPYSSYNLHDGERPQLDIRLVETHAVPFESSPEARLPKQHGESATLLHQRRRDTYENNLKSQAEVLFSFLQAQWPVHTPSYPQMGSRGVYTHFKLKKIMSLIIPIFQSCYKNAEFLRHIDVVQKELLNMNLGPKETRPQYTFDSHKKIRAPSYSKVTLEGIFSRIPPDVTGIPVHINAQPTISQGENELKSLLLELEAAHSNQFEKEYANNMLNSYEALHKKSTTVFSGLPSKEALLKDRLQFENRMQSIFQSIEKALGPVSAIQDLMGMTGLWPNISPISLLQRLASNASVDLSPGWRQVLIEYGEAVTMFQRAERLLDYSESGGDDFARESENPGGQGRNQVAYSDWLLISIDNNLLVRPVQTQIALEMIAPSSGKNQTLQLNMGEGKSSVIVPIVSAALADGKKLVRVVVLKPLSGQMFRLLVQKLSGLANRRIFYMPFYRQVKLDEKAVRNIQDLYQECMEVGGILLVQPEHLLSFKLMGLDLLFTPQGDKGVASALIRCQRWLERNSRDILDESDEILHTKHELIYTIGASASVELSPNRWTIVQEIFGRIKVHTKAMEGVEVKGIPQSFPGSFPTTRILEPKSGDELMSRITEDVFDGCLKTVSFRLFPDHIRELAIQFVTKQGITEAESEPLFKDMDDISRLTLLLLRGLIAGEILCNALGKKRWRVEYGLDLSRSMLAVPYRAKDCPAQRAEFSHPDVAITLTCLSYYYAGLTETQLEHCFATLLKSDNPGMEYAIWVEKDTTLPIVFRELSGINLVDKEQCTNFIFPRFRHNKAAIDFYLAWVVFPTEVREFPHKLSSSGWDIAETKKHPTTGFSGTNDNRHLLPLSIKQHESEGQLSTNAKVLSYLLQPENSYLCAKGENEQRLDVDSLLDKLVQQDPQIRVLLDVGAQVLEKRNFEVARDWLSRVPESKASVYFNEEDELTVITRDGHPEPLMVSAFAKQMDECLVYLDEVHTRGTDLKLPKETRAAVTLGPNLTKDRLVQACMRMRKLGQGQSVIFCAPPEIHQKILVTARKSSVDSVSVSDVLRWSMHETFVSTKNTVQTWARQGISYQNRNVAWKLHKDIKQMESIMVEPDAQSLEERFGPLKSGKEQFHTGTIPKERHYEISLIEENCKKFSITSLRGSEVHEEQERELEIEVEREQQRELPSPVGARRHAIHPDIKKFVQTGTLSEESTAVVPAFDLFQESRSEFQKDAWSKRLLITKDFATTTNGSRFPYMNAFLPPVNWLVSSFTENTYLVIMSSYEINALLPIIISHDAVRLHMYAPKVTKYMRTFEDLKFCTVPSVESVPDAGWSAPKSLVDQLNIFSGQLFLQDYETYERLGNFLGLYLKDHVSHVEGGVPETDGFVGSDQTRIALGMKPTLFTKSPVPFLRKLMNCRRKGQNFAATHMGQVLQGKILTKNDLEYEYPVEGVAQGVVVMEVGRQRIGERMDEKLGRSNEEGESQFDEDEIDDDEDEEDWDDEEEEDEESDDEGEDEEGGRRG